MNYILLMDLAIDLGYELAMSGAETFRVEESVTRMLAAYGVDSDVFAIPNYIMITIRRKDGTPITRMRRIGYHGNNMDNVERGFGRVDLFSGKHVHAQGDTVIKGFCHCGWIQRQPCAGKPGRGACKLPASGRLFHRHRR